MRIWLVQRLKKAWESNPKNKMSLLANVFSFGGGLVHGGFSKEAWEMITKLIRFDYMGASEYEWGAVPDAFRKIAKDNKDYITDKMDVKISGYSFDTHKREKGKATVYIITKPEWLEETKVFIKKCAVGKEELKERALLDSAVINKKDDLVGWIELENGFMFFTDKGMFDNMCQLFKIKEVEMKHKRGVLV